MALSLNRNYDPFWVVRDLQKQMDGVFDDFYGTRGDELQPAMSSMMKWAPVVDMRENDNSFLIHAELPGMKRDDISLDLQGNVLTLSGEKSEKKKEDNERVHRVERSYGKFTRTFTLPKNANADDIAASFEDGVLELSIPKMAPAKPDVKKINIKGAATQSK